MKRKINTLVIVAALFGGFFGSFFVAQTAIAACDNGGQSAASGVELGSEKKGDCTKTTSFAFADCDNTDVGISCLVKEGLQVMSGIVGVAVVGGVVWGGITYATASGSPANVQKGRKIIGNSLMGLILFALMYAIIAFLLPGEVLTK